MLLESEGYVQIKGTIISKKMIKGANNRSRLVAIIRDKSNLELVWFQSAKWVEKSIEVGKEYLVYGKVSSFKGKKSMAHPELELFQIGMLKDKTMEPIYPSTETLNSRALGSKVRRNLIQNVFKQIKRSDILENLSEPLLTRLKLIGRIEALHAIHFPKNPEQLKAATNRLKFEEIFFFQLRMLFNKKLRKAKTRGLVFENVGDNFLKFYNDKLSFDLTNAQKRVIKEIRADLGSGIQMNRLLQGDVGSGKTIVALLCMLLSLDNGHQATIMAPTEILAQQHFEGIGESLRDLGIQIAFLSGSIKGKKRQAILEQLEEGKIDIIVGTHALLEDHVKFKNLGLAIIDEQHRFGVAQRARLWKKNKHIPPHILVMTATPIPRTLAMTVYGDLDVSIIDELPPGRKAVKTIHRSEHHRAQVIQFLHEEIKKGRQVYIVYPLIEESAKLDLMNLQQGYEELLQFFPPPDFKISVVHGRMKSADKDLEMQRFINKVTQIMVATTVIEVGVNVPNASVMVINNTERFGLSQLHQLRGRVGRGADQSFCLLMSGYKLSKEGKKRIETMVSSNDGFVIAEADLKLRGPGNIEGLRQSGIMEFKLLNIVEDQAILKTARHLVENILEEDPELTTVHNFPLLRHLHQIQGPKKGWGKIS